MIQLFLVDSYLVPTGSMESIIVPGDYIFVNKLSYGPKWPQSPLQISWFNLLALNENFFPWFRDTKWPIKRWPEGGAISRNDVVVFEMPRENRTILVKRCKGLPGELIELKEDQLYINNQPVGEPETVTYTYNSTLTDTLINSLTDFEHKIQRIFYGNGRRNYKLNHEYVQKIKKKFGKNSVRVNPYYGRSNNHYGKVLLPYKGASINLYDYIHEIRPYKRAIEEFEGVSFKMSGDSIMINGKLSSIFTFTNNYYFMLGDNRHGSQDSRVWGFVPEQNIIGKATRVWYSNDKKMSKIRWNRIFMKIE